MSRTITFQTNMTSDDVLIALEIASVALEIDSVFQTIKEKMKISDGHLNRIHDQVVYFLEN